jgi:hypothetical protein
MGMRAANSRFKALASQGNLNGVTIKIRVMAMIHRLLSNLFFLLECVPDSCRSAPGRLLGRADKQRRVYAPE